MTNLQLYFQLLSKTWWLFAIIIIAITVTGAIEIIEIRKGTSND